VIIIALRNIICFAGIIVLSPLLMVVAFCVLIEDGMPIFFKQKRRGQNNKIFLIYKIRTMKKNTPELGTHDVDSIYKLKTGMLIRALKIDEFPQLVNVLKGNLNLVGPRPGLETQIELTNARLDKNIYRAKPGITGLAQILGYDMSNPKELAVIDSIYLENESLKIKMLILLGTFFKYPRNYLANQFKIKNHKEDL
jgi:O-antigen biosynthesis protein WbqP